MLPITHSAALFSLALTFVLAGCAPAVEVVETREPRSRIVSTTSSSDLKEVGFGEALWLNRSVQTDRLWSDGKVISSKRSELLLCRDRAGQGPSCVSVEVPDSQLSTDDAIPSNRTSQQKSMQSSDISGNCRGRCSLFVNQGVASMGISDGRSQLATKCVEACRKSGSFVTCMAAGSDSDVFERCADSLQ